MTTLHSNKKAVALAAAAAAVTGGALAATNTAHADTINSASDSQATTNNQSEVVKTAQEQAQDKALAAGNAMKDAQNVMNNAQSKADQADAKVAQNNAQVNTDTQAVQQAQTAVNNAQSASDRAHQALSQAQTNAQAATPEAISQAQADVQTAKTAEKAAGNAVQDKQGDVKSAQADLSQSQAKAQEAAKKVANDQQAVSQAERSLDQQGAQNDVAQAQADLSKAQNAEKTAQDEVNQKNGDVQADQSEVNKAQDSVKTAQADVNSKAESEQNAKTTLDQAQNDVNAKQTALTNAQTALQQAQNQSTSGSITDPAQWGINVTATNDAKAAAQEYRNGNHDNSVINRMLNGMTIQYNPTSKDQQILDNNAYVNQSMPNVINQMYTSNPQLKVELNDFVAGLLNSIRQSLGFNTTIIPNSALIDDAHTYINNPKTRHTPLFGDIADFSGLTGNVETETEWKDGFSTRGTNDFLSGNQPYSLELASSTAPKHGLRLADIKGYIFSLLLTGDGNAKGLVNGALNNQHSWSINDGNNGVAFNPQQNTGLVLGTTQIDNSQSQTYIGLGLANPSGTTKGASMIVLTSGNVGAGTNYGLNQNTTNTSALQAKVNQAQTALDQAKTALNNAKSAHDNAAQNLATAKAALTKAQEAEKGAQDKLATAEQSLKSAQSAYQKAQADVQTASQKLAQAQQAAQDANKSQAEKQQALQNAKAKLAQDQKKLDDANQAVKTNQDKLAQAQSALKQAQTDLKNKEAATQKLVQKLNDLQNAQTLLKQAQDNAKAADDLLSQKTDQLKQAKDVLNSAQTKLDTAKTNAKLAHDQLDKAKANFQAKKNAYDDAVAHLISDAQQYGLQVKLAQDHFTINEGDQLPTLKLDNQFAPHRENSAITNMFMNLAAMPGDVLPEGTKISWADPTKANTDAQHAGDYTENVLITFPDGSTITKQVELTVKYNPALHQTQTDITNVPGLPAGTHVINGQVVNANGQIMPEYQVINGQIVKTTTATQLTKASNAISSENTPLKRSDLNNGKLPQTGDHNEAGLIGLGVATMLSMFGLVSVRRKD
ncbi:hypothetical protein FD32_GL001694 [Limosilactobacillus panis DSM 6035]|uniref:Gram-positive cocci surface proteins LPxTG domain-containing protein n=2 Tax=Limosilactobacillus panis TaxID=47493 RepID=A0A0R1XJK5_9LACO|nr:Rib/alpha-like domain-containing protein [Limosilactobacillus panis]KRM30362.1 hypothetical protein FD32_GL001694 [Limosilactobacillus panis DSM 6035]